MRYLSVCSGIEAASVAWHPLGFQAVAFAEIDAFPSAVLKHHYPQVPNWGDMTRFQEWPDATFDVLVGGTPCQSFSVAGLRAGLADPRGNLALTYLAVLDRYRPSWCCWENVPGVLSADDGRAMGAFLGGLGQLGYGFAYRVLDAQYFGLAQRRARVFVVGHLGDWRRAAAVLFERESLQRHPAPSREAREGVAGTLGGSSQSGGFRTTDLDNSGAFIPEIGSQPMSAKWSKGSSGPAGDEVANLIAFDTTQITHPENRSSRSGSIGETVSALTKEADRGDGFPCVAFSVKDHTADAGELAPTLRAGGHAKSHANGGCMPAVAFADVADPVAANQARTYTREGAHNFRLSNIAHTAMSVRRLTPRECERLQGFPDDYTLIPYRGKPAADGPRYKALGNGMAVPVMRWIGQRIALVESVCEELQEQGA